METKTIQQNLNRREAVDAMNVTLTRFSALLNNLSTDPRSRLYDEKLTKIINKLEYENYYLKVNQFFLSGEYDRLSAEGVRELLLKMRELSQKFCLKVDIPQNIKVTAENILVEFVTKLTARASEALDSNIALLPQIENELKKQAVQIDITKPLGQFSQLELCILRKRQYTEGIYSRPDLYQRINGLDENTKEYKDIQSKLNAIEKLPKDYPLIRFLSGSTDSTKVTGEIEKAVKTVSDAQNKIKELIEEGKFPVWELEELVEAEKATYTDPKEIAEIDAWLKKQKTNKKIKDILMTLVPIGLSLIVFFIPGGASLLLLGIKAGAQILNAGLGAVSAYQDFQDARMELLRSNADVILSDAQIDLLQSQGKDAAVLQFFLVFISAIGTVADIADSARMLKLYNKADNIGAAARIKLQSCKVKSTLFQDLSEEQLINLSYRLDQFDDIAKLPSDKVVQFLDDTRDFAVTKEVLKKSECSQETLKLYLQSVDQKNGTYYLYIYEKTGYWPDELWIPVNESAVNEKGFFNWDLAKENGFKLNPKGEAIKEKFIPKIGEKIDRYGPENGRYVSPIIDGKPFAYNQRSLPYVEDVRQYHQYEVIGDFGNIQDYIDKLTDKTTKLKIEAYIKKFYNGDISKLNVYKGDIAPVKEWNSINCGIQYEFPLPVDYLVELGLLR